MMNFCENELLLVLTLFSLSHYLFDTSRVYTIVKILLKQNYIQLYVS